MVEQYPAPAIMMTNRTDLGQSSGKTIPYSLRRPIPKHNMYFDNMYSSSAILMGQAVPQTRRGYYEETMYMSTVRAAVPPGDKAPYPGYIGSTLQGSRTAEHHRHRAEMAGQHPWHPVHSPVPWLIGMFIVGILLIRFVHWPPA